MSARPETIVEFLSDRDAHCPGCGYNLRGITSGHCPECDWTVALRLARARWPDRYRTLLLVSCSAILLAGIPDALLLPYFVRDVLGTQRATIPAGFLLQFSVTSALSVLSGVAALIAGFQLLFLRRTTRTPTAALIALAIVTTLVAFRFVMTVSHFVQSF